MTHASHWTESLVEEAKYLYLEQKFSATAIANIFFGKYQISFSRNAIIGKMARAGARRAPTSTNLAKRYSAVAPASKPKPLEPLQALFVPTVIIPKRDPKPLLECEDDGCRFECSGQDWPGEVSEFLFCNQPVHEGTPYCAKHCKRAYLPRKKKNQKEAA